MRGKFDSHKPNEATQDILGAGEKIIWTGQPRTQMDLDDALLPLIFGLSLMALATFWAWISWRMISRGGLAAWRLEILCPAFGIPFVIISLAVLLSPVWVKARRQRTRYAITNRRAILWEPNLLGYIRVSSYYSEDINGLTSREKNDGSGDLIFEEFKTTDMHGTVHYARRGFFHIDNVRDVEEVVRMLLIEDV